MRNFPLGQRRNGKNIEGDSKVTEALFNAFESSYKGYTIPFINQIFGKKLKPAQRTELNVQIKVKT